MKTPAFNLYPLVLLSLVFFTACSTSGPAGLFGKKSPHDEYADKIKNAGLQETALGRKWFAAAEKAIHSPLAVTIPYSETGYFAAEEPRAAGLLFAGKRGEKLIVSLTKNPIGSFAIYLDLWRANVNDTSFVAAADTSGNAITYEVDKDSKYVVRLQPELLKGGEYTLTITSGPSLAFPVAPGAKSNIGSFWGDGRDAGQRKHEGIDIFAARGTALVAAADGVVTRVNENKLGGKVVFLTPDQKNYTLYYAHLDEQLVQPGQRVKTGDTIGLVGNTGNAKTTAPHLHFGIYTGSGAIDPLPFVNRSVKKPEKIVANTGNLHQWVRANRNVRVTSAPGTDAMIGNNTLLKVEAATADKYKVLLPDETVALVPANYTSILANALSKLNLPVETFLLDEPATTAARKEILQKGKSLRVLASFKEFYYVADADDNMGWILKNAL